MNGEQGPELPSNLVRINASKRDAIMTSPLQDTARGEQRTDADSRTQKVGGTATLVKVLDPCTFLDEHHTQPSSKDGRVDYDCGDGSASLVHFSGYSQRFSATTHTT